MITELVKDCKLVQTGYEPNGHDCWGNTEHSSYKYVMINGGKEKCWDDWYIVHDGEKALEVLSPWLKEQRDKDANKKPIEHGDNCGNWRTACQKCIDEYREWKKNKDK